MIPSIDDSTISLRIIINDVLIQDVGKINILEPFPITL